MEAPVWRASGDRIKLSDDKVGDFASYHRRVGHEEWKSCVCGAEKEPDHPFECIVMRDEPRVDDRNGKELGSFLAKYQQRCAQVEKDKRPLGTGEGSKGGEDTVTIAPSAVVEAPPEALETQHG